MDLKLMAQLVLLILVGAVVDRKEAQLGEVVEIALEVPVVPA